MGGRHCHTTGRARACLVHQVQENRTAAPLPPNPSVPVDIEHDVVLTVAAAHLFMAGRVGSLNRTIVIAVAGCVTPAVIGPKRAQGKAAARRQAPIPPPIPGPQRVASTRACAIALAFVMFGTVPPDAAGHEDCACLEQCAWTARFKTENLKPLNILPLHALTHRKVSQPHHARLAGFQGRPYLLTPYFWLAGR